MWLLLTDRARKRLTQKGSGAAEESIWMNRETQPRWTSRILRELDRALTRLEHRDKRQLEIVELRYIAGLTEEETAAAQDISPRTVRREWAAVRRWLNAELSRIQDSPGPAGE